MKKLLSLIGAMSIVGSGAATVISCSDNSTSDKQKTDAIKNKITNVDLTVPSGTNPDTSNRITTAAIRITLQSVNPTLSDSDLEDITFVKTTLQSGTPVKVTATIAVGSAKETVGLNVTWAQSNQQKADAIKNKITNVNLTVPAGTNPDTANPATITAMKEALQTANPTLTDDDLSTITFASATLQTGTSVIVPITITVGTVGTATADKDITVTLSQSDQQKADAIKAKITNVNLTVPAGTNPDTTNKDTIVAIKKALQTANPTLTDDDLVTITFVQTTLQVGGSVVVTATITVGSAKDTVDLNVTLSASDQQKVDAVRDKITDTNLTVPPGTNPDTTNTITIATIEIVLQSANPTLTDSDLSIIQFASATLQAGTPETVTATITAGKASDTVDLSVTLAVSDQQKADAIKGKIAKVNLTVPAGTNPDTTNPATIAAIKKALQTANPTLTDDDLATITFGSATLQAGTSVIVPVTITVGTATADKDITVTLTQSDQQKADAIKAKITNVDLIAPAGTNPDTTNKDTIAAIKKALQTANPAVTSDDLATITFASTTLQVDIGVLVTATITVGSATDTVDLNVKLAETDQQKADAIRNEITNVNLTVPAGTNPDTTNADTIAAIKKALQTANPAVTSDDLATITFAKATLQTDLSVEVAATITVGTAKATISLNITLYSADQEKADAIKNKITTTDIALPTGTNPSTKTGGTQAAIKKALQTANPTLTNDDLAKIIFSITTLIPGGSVSVQANIEVGAAVATKNINVTLNGTDQQKANAIKGKITFPIAIIPYDGKPTESTNDPGVAQKIKESLKETNPQLTDDDLAKITFALIDINTGSLQGVVATITVGQAKTTILLSVGIANPPS